MRTSSVSGLDDLLIALVSGAGSCTGSRSYTFEEIRHEAHHHTSVCIAAYCLMPNHWHLLLWPRSDGKLTHRSQMIFERVPSDVDRLVAQIR
jgi:hypothetical protein